VIVVGPPEADAAALAEADVEAELTAALSRMSVRDAVAAVAAATGRRRSQVYALALRLNGRTARGRD